MHKKQGQLCFSPSDLTGFIESPFASWMDRYAAEYPDRSPLKDPKDPLVETLAKQGYVHEDAQQARFESEGLVVVGIEGELSQERYARTLAAMQKGVDIIVQARLEHADFAGYADFLVKVTHAEGEPPSLLGDWHYEVWDTKLSKKIKPTFVVQLCCYAEMLAVVQGILPANIVVALGDGSQQRLVTRDYYYYYKAQKQAFLQSQNQFDPQKMPDPADSKSYGDWSSYAAELFVKNDHLSQVATITRGQIKKLNKAGVFTMQALVDNSAKALPGLPAETLSKLVAQAAIQKRSSGLGIPEFEVLTQSENPKMGLALLPPHSPMDIFFDIEGYPLDDGGLEYLWGNTYFDAKGERKFKDFWAHNRDQEKQCFIDFISWVYQRWQQDPSMHIYHYANYEIAACRKLMGRYGVCEYEVDQLLRNEVFIDLYKIVKGGILLGEPRYSIKNVEHLYRGKRETEVANGSDSVVVYENWRELNARGEEGDSWQTSPILNDIRNYNIDDCESTQELVDWLRQQQASHNIAYLGKTEIHEPELSEQITERTALRDRLLAQLPEQRENYDDGHRLLENLAWVLEFHRREAKPIFWRLFDRLGRTEPELMAELDCLAGCQRTERKPFKATNRAKNYSYEYHFDATQEFKGAHKSFYLLGLENESGGNVKATYVAEESNLEEGCIVLSSAKELPETVTLIPDEFVNADPIPQAITETVKEHCQGKKPPSESAILDFLMRAQPRIAGHTGGAIASSSDPAERLEQITLAISQLQHSYLPIQGPPGAGKSFTGKKVIAALLKRGAKIGIASNSHKAINNLLLSAAEECKSQGVTATFACTKETDTELQEHGVVIAKNNQLSGLLDGPSVVGTTAWGFAREDMASQLDYLFVDEAGQVAVANLIAMSRSANNLVLLGDQMQLGQPSQGTHPAESGLSVLDYLLHETATIPDNMGIFLGTTYRMHSTINRLISEQIYDGKLDSHPSTDQRTIAVPPDYSGPLNKEAGIVFVPVEHSGNTQAADEEVTAIKALAGELIGRSFCPGNGKPDRPISWDDMLFVAPYNHQVSKLKTALGERAKVGSVDRFQGQEAAIVFLSMCASDPEESPRGIDFLFDKHRLNVAISRAQSLVVVVANPAISNVPVAKVEQLKRVNLFNAVIQYGQ